MFLPFILASPYWAIASELRKAKMSLYLIKHYAIKAYRKWRYNSTYS
jgi:hypothetical protein